MSEFQTAKTLSPGTVRILPSVGIYNSSRLDIDISEEDSIYPVFLFMEFNVQIGIFKNFEGGSKWYTSGAIFYLKYQFIDNQQGFNMACGAGIGSFHMEPIAGLASTDYYVTDKIFPFYFSFDYLKYSIYLIPKYIYREFTGSSTGNTHLLGGNLGIRLGHKKGVFIEINSMKNFEGKFSNFQFNLAYFKDI